MRRRTRTRIPKADTDTQKPIIDFYREHWASSNWREQYKVKRERIYSRMLDIAQAINAHTVLDVGCAYGLFVERCNCAGIDAWGVDLPIEELKTYHATLPLSRGKIFYGTMDEMWFQKSVASERNWDLVTCVETMRYIADENALYRLNARRYLIKEASDNARVRYARQRENDLHLWSPCTLLSRFPGYQIERIWLPRFAVGFKFPSRTICMAINHIFPTYAVLLCRRDTSN